jgi:SHS2 domain-containing protein
VNNYELFEHTADIGVRVKGSNLTELFTNAARAMFDIIAEEESQGSLIKNQVTLKADNQEELFIGWLNELLYLSATKGLIFVEFEIKKIQDGFLEAEVFGRDTKDYRVNTEIKAATYHQLGITKTNDGLQAEVILDV